MIALVFYFAAAFGAAYIVGHARVSLGVRTALAEQRWHPTWPLTLTFVELLECPACFGTWFGFFVGIARHELVPLVPTLPPGQLGEAITATASGVWLALATAGSNYILARLTRLVPPMAHSEPVTGWISEPGELTTNLKKAVAPGEQIAASWPEEFVRAEAHEAASDLDEPEDPENDERLERTAAAVKDGDAFWLDRLHASDLILFKFRHRKDAALAHCEAKSLQAAREIFRAADYELISALAWDSPIEIIDHNLTTEQLGFGPSKETK